MESHYASPAMCAQCGGECCKRYAGIYAPEDLRKEITVDVILQLLQTEKYAIDWWEGDVLNNENNIYFLRPRHVDRAVIQGGRGQCVHLTDAGCSLPVEEKPYQCRALIPDYPNCTTNPKDRATKKDMADRWKPYQQMMIAALEHFRRNYE